MNPVISLRTASSSLQHILCLGAHCDDIEIGCGGTVLALVRSNPDIHISWVIFTSSDARKREAEVGAKLFTCGAARVDTRILDFRDGFLPYSGAAVKEAFEQLKAELPSSPDLILTHYRHDLHQDHRLVSELTWNTFRNHLVLEYEIPKWDGDLGQPNTYLPIDREISERKIALLQQAYNSQKSKNWFTDDLFWSLLRIRGMECNSPSMLAEAFYARKTVLTIN